MGWRFARGEDVIRGTGLEREVTPPSLKETISCAPKPKVSVVAPGVPKTPPLMTMLAILEVQRVAVLHRAAPKSSPPRSSTSSAVPIFPSSPGLMPARMIARDPVAAHAHRADLRVGIQAERIRTV